MNRYRIDVQDLANFIFIKNTNNNNIVIELSSITNNKELFFFLFDLLCKGIILVYGKDESNKVCLNHLTIDQFEYIKKKFKNAHIHLQIVIYDIKTAIMLDLLEENYAEKNIIRESVDSLQSMDVDKALSDYVFNLIIDDNLFCINFEIIQRGV